MIRNSLVLPDGTRLEAGTPGQSALRSLQWTSTVNAGTDLNPGSACSDCLEAEIWVEPGAGPGVAAGQRVELWRQGADGVARRAGVFVAQQPVRTRRNLYRLTAYDPLCLTEQDLSPWLRDRQGSFPQSLADFSRAVAAACGVTLANDPPRNGDYQVQRFYADGLTGRQLLQWAAQAAGCYLHCNADGALAFGWYTDRRGQYSLCPGTAAAADLGTPLPYRQDGLEYSDYETAPIDKVQIRQSGTDVGVIWPQGETGTNALVVEGNLLLTAQSADALRPVAQALYEAAAAWPAYTPCKVRAFGDSPVAPGDLLYVVTPRGERRTTCVMQGVYTAGQTRLESTGNPRRDSVAAVNAARYTNLEGRLLEIQADVDGLQIRASDLQGQYSQLSQSVDSITLQVQDTGPDLLAEAVWMLNNEVPEGCVVKNGDVVTLQPREDLTQTLGIQIDVPAAQLAAMAGQRWKLQLDYRVEEELYTDQGRNAVTLWEYYPDSKRSTTVVTLSASGTPAPAGDWQTAQLTFTCPDQAPTRCVVYAYLYAGRGKVSLRQPRLTSASPQGSQIRLTRDGVTIGSALLDFSGFAAQEDYTQLKLEQEELALTVVRDGQVRSAFAADGSSITIQSGVVRFAANTLVVDSDNFKLTEAGTVTITGMFFSETAQDRVDIANGAIHMYRKVSDGRWLQSAQLWSAGTNASTGNLILEGPGPDGNQYTGFSAGANFSGGFLSVYNAAGDPRFWIRINESGDGEIWLNGRKLF